LDWSVLQHHYFQRAALAGLCAGVTCSAAGVFVVTMHLSSLGVCIAHAAFAGALLGVWLQFDPLVGALVFSVATAAAVGPMADRGGLTPDSSIGILFSTMLGLGFLFMAMAPGARVEALNFFWGSILTVSRKELACLAVTMVVVLGFTALFFKEIQCVICHRHVAVRVGIPAAVVFYGMLLITGVTVAVSLRSVGGLLIYSLILNPAAAALQLTYSLKRMFFLASLFGVLSCWVGLFASLIWDLPVGASIVLTSSFIFAAALLASPKRRGWIRAVEG